MAYIKEPEGVDLNIGPMPVNEEDLKIVSAIIAHYKKTGEVLEAKGKKLQKKVKSKTQAIVRQ
ncbi:MAG: hypothetical protein IT270_00390 [Saprospiraceae bacterium]|nr:hypothetical protein [Saprospiraceae bacterium]